MGKSGFAFPTTTKTKLFNSLCKPIGSLLLLLSFISIFIVSFHFKCSHFSLQSLSLYAFLIISSSSLFLLFTCFLFLIISFLEDIWLKLWILLQLHFHQLLLRGPMGWLWFPFGPIFWWTLQVRPISSWSTLIFFFFLNFSQLSIFIFWIRFLYS